MKTYLRYAVVLLGLSVFVPVFYSCSKDEEKKVPEALFSFTAGGDGRTITFTNESTDANSYAWDFGDGETSTEASPVHIFPALGKYTITLTATGSGGENTFTYEITVSKSSVVKLDDSSVSDWATVPDVFVAVDNNGGLMKRVKLDYDGEYLYFYLEVQDQLSDSTFTGIHLDLDNDSTTGFDPWTNTNIGSDLYLEGRFLTAFEQTVFEVDPLLDPGWPWSAVAVSDFIVYGAHIQDGAVVKTEFALKRSKMNAPKVGLSMGEKVTLIINHYFEWEPAGFFPVSGSPAFIYEMP
jgi:PKD repeat protein